VTTDIVFDDKDGNCVSLSCTELATSAFDITIDNPTSRSATGGARRALRHDNQDGLSINPERDYPAGVSMQCATINLKVNEQHAMAAALPKRARMGDLFLVHTSYTVAAHSDEPRHIVETCTLWLCVGTTGGIANWAQVGLGAAVPGTI
jgi:hypothetical protein